MSGSHQTRSACMVRCGGRPTRTTFRSVSPPISTRASASLNNCASRVNPGSRPSKPDLRLLQLTHRPAPRPGSGQRPEVRCGYTYRVIVPPKNYPIIGRFQEVRWDAGPCDKPRSGAGLERHPKKTDVVQTVWIKRRPRCGVHVTGFVQASRSVGKKIENRDAIL